MNLEQGMQGAFEGETQYAASKTIILPVPTADTAKLAKAALNALQSLWRPNLRYKKAGIILLDLVPAASVQGDLWEEPDDAKSKAIMRALDRLNAVHGRDTITLALSGRRPKWGLRSEKRSPRYTTEWDELLRWRSR